MAKLTAENDLFEYYKLRYKGNVPAAALFFHEKHYALRVEVPALGKEFTYGLFIGTDPEGYLYYNDTGDLNHPTRFRVLQVNNPLDSDLNPCVKIEFWYADIPDASDPYAIFLGADPAGVIAKTGFHEFDSSAQPEVEYSIKCPTWGDLKLAQVSATVDMNSGLPSMTLTADVINKEATWHVDKDYFPFGTAVHSHGTLSCKSIAHLTSKMASTVSYSGDRLVFYRGRNAKDFVAFFAPFMGVTSASGPDNSLGDVEEREFHGVRWSRRATSQSLLQDDAEDDEFEQESH